jgi:hypothetical protein
MKMGNLMVLAVLLCSSLISRRGSAGDDAVYQPDRFFNDQVLSILRTRCFKCHSREHEVEGGLALDSRAGWKLGGESGAAVRPKDLKNSPLIQAIKHHDAETAMPPKKKLSDYEIALLESGLAYTWDMRFDFVVVCLMGFHSAVAAPVVVTVSITGMTRGREPYFVEGAGGDKKLDQLAGAGANSIRTWSTNGLAEILDEAAKLNLTVSAGIWLESECSWFSNGKPEDCAEQMERVKQEILSHKDHPALLAWGLGNEAEGDGSNAGYWQQLERLALMVKELDPAHPTFTAVAGLSEEKAMGLEAHAPHLDYVGINTYGALFGLRKRLAKMGWSRPWMLTEWGPQGFWERPKHPSGAVLEQTSTQKAEMMRRGYDEVISLGGACLGSYAFVWGWKYEATVTWFGLLTHEGDTPASFDVLAEKWKERPKNVAPSIEPVTGVPADTLKPRASFTATVKATDVDGDSLSWHWAVLPEQKGHNAGKKPPMPKPISDTITEGVGPEVKVQAPVKPGVYRLPVWVTDGKGHAATANVPFAVAE